MVRSSIRLSMATKNSRPTTAVLQNFWGQNKLVSRVKTKMEDPGIDTPLLHRKTLTTSDPDEMEPYNKAKGVTILKSRQYLITLTLLSVKFCVIMTDTALFPFFPAAAKRKGLEETQTGVIFASYEICRFLASPLNGILVSAMILNFNFKSELFIEVVMIVSHLPFTTLTQYKIVFRSC